MDILNFDQNYKNIAWYIINDMLFTDLPIMYPPYLLAISSIYITISYFKTIDENIDKRDTVDEKIDKRDIVDEKIDKREIVYDKENVRIWFKNLNVDFCEVGKITNKFLEFLTSYKNFSYENSWNILKKLRGNVSEI